MKLFDFGLATTLPSQRKVGENQYKLTGNTGTRRYMAPEVARCMPYGLPADVFSFTILLWEILSLNVAFENETRESHTRKVYGYRNYRPSIPIHWPRLLQRVIKESWSVDTCLRPTFQHIRLCLRQSHH